MFDFFLGLGCVCLGVFVIHLYGGIDRNLKINASAVILFGSSAMLQKLGFTRIGSAISFGTIIAIFMVYIPWRKLFEIPAELQRAEEEVRRLEKD